MLIQKLRLQRGWSQQQLADLSGLNVRTIQRIEQGKSASVESLKSLAAVFEVDFTTLQTEPDMNIAADTDISSEEKLAFHHVQKVKQFYLRLIRSIIIIALLVVFNIVQTPHVYWSLWVAVIWGTVILLRGLAVFERFPFSLLDARWEKKQVERRLGRSL